MKVGVTKLNGSACTQAKVDRIKNRGFSTIARAYQAINSFRWKPRELFYTPEVCNLDLSYSRHCVLTFMYKLSALVERTLELIRLERLKTGFKLAISATWNRRSNRQPGLSSRAAIIVSRVGYSSRPNTTLRTGFQSSSPPSWMLRPPAPTQTATRLSSSAFASSSMTERP